ncbi:MAG: hypothetical protein ACP5GZ_11355 [Vulcanisaeta sp.]|jgi:hypothetical protein|uniref:hypothetical protein n=1 Tax=Vulcanisaeta sp. TaxID=2020871 RepID=UPI003D0F0549
MTLVLAHILSWLKTYEGNECELYRKVYNTCNSSNICHTALNLLQITPKCSLNYELRPSDCIKFIEQSIYCISKNDVDCTYKFLIELFNHKCHDGYAFSNDIVKKVKEITHYIWKNMDRDRRCDFLKYLREIGLSKWWIRDALGFSSNAMNKIINRCKTTWEVRMPQNEVAKYYDQVIKQKFNLNEIKECEGLLKYYGIDVGYMKGLGIEPCSYLNTEGLRWPYWAGLYITDLYAEFIEDRYKLSFDTSNGAGLFMAITVFSKLNDPSIVIRWHKNGAPNARYINGEEIRIKTITYIRDWPWLNKNQVINDYLQDLRRDELLEFLAGIIDGDGSITFTKGKPAVNIVAGLEKYYWLKKVKAIIAQKLNLECSITPKNFKITNELIYILSFKGSNIPSILEEIAPYLHHPIRRIRAELITAYLRHELNDEEFLRIYEQTKYKIKQPDIKRNSALNAAINASSMI